MEKAKPNQTFQVKIQTELNVLQWEPENSKIEKRILDLSYDFKYHNEHVTRQFCSEYRPISLIKGLNKFK